MKIETPIKAEKVMVNHNQTLIRDKFQAKGFKVKTQVKAGGTKFNHSETLVCDQANNHNQTLLRN